MSLPLKVLWSEGLTLGPQQFQQFDRYHEARLQRTAAALNPHLWGVLAVQWNLDGLLNNKLSAETLSLIFQDGEIYEAPLADALPSPVDLSKLPPDEHSFTFYAALPALKAHGGNVRYPDARVDGARYVAVSTEMADLCGSALHVEVSCLRKSVQLLSHLEPRGEHVCFPVIRLRRLASGGFEADPGFMPPSVALRSAAGLQLLLDALLAKLNAKIKALYLRHRQPSKDVVEVHAGDLSSFWMLSTVSAAAAALSHCARHRQHHPEYLFDRLIAFAGGLMAFSSKYELAELPSYDHENPAPGFLRLDAIVRELVDTVISSKYLTLPLHQDERRTTHYRAQLDPAAAGREARLCLAVQADMAALELVQLAPLRFKIAGPDQIEGLINSALRGIELVHMAQVPSAVPVRPNTYYFSIEPKGGLHEAMMKAQAMTLYVPAGFDGLRLELFAITA